MLTQVFHPPAIERPPFLPGAWRRGLSVRPLIFSGSFFVLTMIIICDGVGVHTKALHSGCRESNCTRRRWWSGGSDPRTHTPYHRPLYFTSLFKKSRGSIYYLSVSSFFWLFFRSSRRVLGRLARDVCIAPASGRFSTSLPRSAFFAPPLIFLFSSLSSNRSMFFSLDTSPIWTLAGVAPVRRFLFSREDGIRRKGWFQIKLGSR